MEFNHGSPGGDQHPARGSTPLAHWTSPLTRFSMDSWKFVICRRVSLSLLTSFTHCARSCGQETVRQASLPTPLARPLRWAVEDQPPPGGREVAASLGTQPATPAPSPSWRPRPAAGSPFPWHPACVSLAPVWTKESGVTWACPYPPEELPTDADPPGPPRGWGMTQKLMHPTPGSQLFPML